MRGYLLLIIALLAWLVLPALANDAAPPALNENPPPVYDRLAATPMECMMPPWPSMLLDNASSPTDLVKMGVRTSVNFIEDMAIYMNCVGYKVARVAYALCVKLSNAIRDKIASAPAKQAPASQ